MLKILFPKNYGEIERFSESIKFVLPQFLVDQFLCF